LASGERAGGAHSKRERAATRNRQDRRIRKVPDQHKEGRAGGKGGVDQGIGSNIGENGGGEKRRFEKMRGQGVQVSGF